MCDGELRVGQVMPFARVFDGPTFGALLKVVSGLMFMKDASVTPVREQLAGPA